MPRYGLVSKAHRAESLSTVTSKSFILLLLLAPRLSCCCCCLPVVDDDDTVEVRTVLDIVFCGLCCRSFWAASCLTCWAWASSVCS